MAPNRLLAQVSLGPIKGPGIASTDPVGQFEKIVGQVIGVLSIIAVLWFVLQIIFAGYGFLSTQGDQKAMETARKRLTDSILGLTIVIIALGFGALIAKLAGLQNVLDLKAIFNSITFK